MSDTTEYNSGIRNKLTLPHRTIEYLYEGKVPKLFEFLDGETLNRVSRQLDENIRYLTLQINSGAIGGNLATGGLNYDWVINPGDNATIVPKHLPKASLTTAGITKLSRELSTDNSLAATPSMVYEVNEDVKKIVNADTGDVNNLDFSSAQLVERGSLTSESIFNRRQFYLETEHSDNTYTEACGLYIEELRDYVLRFTLSPIKEDIEFYIDPTFKSEDTTIQGTYTHPFKSFQQCWDYIRARMYFTNPKSTITIKFKTDYSDDFNSSEPNRLYSILGSNEQNRIIIDGEDHSIILKPLDISDINLTLKNVTLYNTRDNPIDHLGSMNFIRINNSELKLSNIHISNNLEDLSDSIIYSKNSEIEITDTIHFKTNFNIVAPSFFDMHKSTLFVRPQFFYIIGRNDNVIEFYDGFLRSWNSLNYISSITEFLTPTVTLDCPKYHLIQFSMLDLNGRGNDVLPGLEDGILEVYGSYVR